MKTVQRFQADDGKLFESETEAVKHEIFLARVKGIASMLPPKPTNDGCDFSNGGGFIQHAPEQIRSYKQQILLLAAERLEKPKWIEWAKNPDEVHPQSVVGRVLSDCDSTLYGLWYRLMCTDQDCREWGQPYFAINPGTGQMVKVA